MLTVRIHGDPAPVEDDLPIGVTPVPNGPYRVAGGVVILAADGTPYEV